MQIPSRRHHRRHVRAAATFAAIAVVAAACSSDDPDETLATDSTTIDDDQAASDSDEAGRTTTTVSTTAPAATEAPSENDDRATEAVEADDGSDPYDPTTTPLEFESCGGPFECATFEVPLDYDALTGPRTEIFITRRVATGDRIGPLFVNPGGPGFGAEEMVRGLGEFGPPPLIESFDIIGIDPRGTGRSNPIDCNADDEADAVRTLRTEAADVDAYVEDFRELATTCEERYGVDYLASLTTDNAARDMESVRLALGAEPLSYYGASYGTAIGSVYATLHPDAIRAMVLDAGVPTDPADGTFEDTAGGFELARMRLDTSCDLWLDCPVRDIGFNEAIDEVTTILEEDGSIGTLDATTFTSAISLMWAIPAAMFDVSEGLADALEGDGALLSAIGSEQLPRLGESGNLVPFSGATQAIICADGWNLENSTVDELAGQFERTSAAAPTVGGNWETPCDLWPVTGDGIPGVDYRGDAPILVIGNEGDPITPLDWSVDLAEALGSNATLLVSEATGHTAAFQRPGCIDDQVFAVLFDQTLPADGTRCAIRGLVGIDFTDGPDVVLTRVTTDSPAERAGLLVGDLIVEADGVEVNSFDDIRSGDFGEPLELVIDRDGTVIDVSVVRGPAFHELWRLAE